VAHSLSTPTQHFGGLPACPYAEAAYQRGEVSVIVTDRLDRVASLKTDLPPEAGQTYVIAWTRPWQRSAQAFDEWIDRQNESPSGVWLMGFHPGAEEAEGIPDVPVEIESDYALILMQPLALVVNAARALATRTGYYQGYTDAEYDEILRRDEHANAASNGPSVATRAAASVSNRDRMDSRPAGFWD
jgi:hypothetical protein